MRQSVTLGLVAMTLVLGACAGPQSNGKDKHGLRSASDTLPTPMTADPAAVPAGSTLTGIWTAIDDTKPLTPVAFEVIKATGGWQVTIGDAQPIPQRAGAYLDFRAGQSGTLRLGDLGRGGPPAAFWIQPRLEPVASYDFATPVHLAPASPNRWTGVAHPLQPAIDLHLVFEPAADGAMRAYIRESGRNIGRGRQFGVTLNGAQLTLTNLREPTDTIGGEVSPDGSVRIDLPDFGRALRFRKLAANEPSRFWPRAAASLPYHYRAPRAAGDGWAIADAASQHVDVGLLERLVNRIAAQEQGRSAPAIHSLIVAHRGKLILEEYFHGFDNVPHDVRSAGKTLTTTIVGAAIGHHVPVKPGTPVYPAFAKTYPGIRASALANGMTLGDLMSMRSGYACDDNDPAMPGNEDIIAERGGDITENILRLPSVSRAGAGLSVYCSIDIHLAGATTARRANLWLPDMFERWIARPLDFGPYYWNLTPTGEGYGGGGAYVRPRDLLKIGQLHLSGGVWNGTRILPADWVRQATRQLSSYPPVVPDPPRAPVASDTHGYGYGWHIYTLIAQGRRYPAYVATGNGGQLVITVPSLDLVVGFTGGNYNNYRTWIQWMDRLVPDYIIPAVSAAPVPIVVTDGPRPTGQR